MKINNIIPLILLTVIMASCSGKDDIKEPEPMIDQDTMLDILTDLHQADGLLKIPTVGHQFSDKDSVEVFMEVIEKHGYSKTEFDNCLDYYFLTKPKKLNAIYEQVLERLSKMEDENIQNNRSQQTVNDNLWNLKPSYRLPNDGTSNPIEFSIPLKGRGTYKIRVRAIVHIDDQSDSLSTNIYFWQDDGTENGKIEAWDKHIYEKSGKSNVLTFERQLVKPGFTHLKGRLLDHSPKSGHWEMHSTISGINVIFEAEKRNSPEPMKE